MPDWVVTVAVGIVTAAIVGVLSIWRAARHWKAAQAGRPVTFDASLRADSPPYPKRWRLGWVSTGVGPLTWKPRFSVLRRPVVLPTSATVVEIRRPAGWIEAIRVNPACLVVVARAGNVTVELAVLEVELAMALRALELGSGGGWRVPEPALKDDLLT